VLDEERERGGQGTEAAGREPRLLAVQFWKGCDTFKDEAIVLRERRHQREMAAEWRWLRRRNWRWRFLAPRISHLGPKKGQTFSR
jgi:hypothetical protein